MGKSKNLEELTLQTASIPVSCRSTIPWILTGEQTAGLETLA